MRKQSYFARGKLLLFGEYFVLFGSKALAVPTRFGQHLKVESKRSYDPKLIWQSFDVENNKWFDIEMDLWHFNSQSDEVNPETHKRLQYLLEQVRRENPHFLREKEQVKVETKLEFPIEWGLGSSSSLVYNIAQWAKVNPFDLGARAFGGSGYDIACANAEGPIVYRKDEKPYERTPECSETTFDPIFKNNLYFVYLGNKEKTNEHLERIQKMNLNLSVETVSQVDDLIERVTHCSDLGEFETSIKEYEELVQTHFEISRTKEARFSDYWGEVKSLGAWGGDFVLVTSDRSTEETFKYFQSKGYDTVFSYDDLVCDGTTELHSPFLNQNQVVSTPVSTPSFKS